MDTARYQILAQVRQTTIEQVTGLGFTPTEQRLDFISAVPFQVQLDHSSACQAQRIHTGTNNNPERRCLDVGVGARSRCWEREILDRVVRCHAAATAQQIKDCRRDHALQIGRGKLRDILRGPADPPEPDPHLLLSLADITGGQPVARSGRPNRPGEPTYDVVEQRRQLAVVRRGCGNGALVGRALVQFGSQTGLPEAG